MTTTLYQGDAATVLATLPAQSVRCCVTSPPYYGLRDYGHEGQIGREDTPDAYVARLVEVFRAVRRILTDDGTLWLNLGDSYNSPASNQNGGGLGKRPEWRSDNDTRGGNAEQGRRTKIADGAKQKDLLGIPWLVAFALRADGWYLRSSIVWAKPNAMPESVRDRPTKSHELIFLLSKNAKYYYDNEAIKEPISDVSRARIGQANCANQTGGPKDYGTTGVNTNRSMRKTLETFAKNPEGGRNKRDVWTVSTKPYAGAHFATMPPALVEPCVLAGSAAGDTVIDPFAGSGTTGAVAVQHGRAFIGIDLNAEYLTLARTRIAAAQPPLPLSEAAD